MKFGCRICVDRIDEAIGKIMDLLPILTLICAHDPESERLLSELENNLGLFIKYGKESYTAQERLQVQAPDTDLNPPDRDQGTGMRYNG